MLLNSRHKSIVESEATQNVGPFFCSKAAQAAAVSQGRTVSRPSQEIYSQSCRSGLIADVWSKLRFVIVLFRNFSPFPLPCDTTMQSRTGN